MALTLADADTFDAESRRAVRTATDDAPADESFVADDEEDDDEEEEDEDDDDEDGEEDEEDEDEDEDEDAVTEEAGGPPAPGQAV